MDQTKGRTRRSVLAAAAGGAAALAASAAAPAAVVLGTTATMQTGTDNLSDASTTLSAAPGLNGQSTLAVNNSGTGTALEANGGSIGVKGIGAGVAGVAGIGLGNAAGVTAEASAATAGVIGISGTWGATGTILSDLAITGVYGFAEASADPGTFGSGIWGDSPDTGVYGSGWTGVYGDGSAWSDGVGVYGDGGTTGIGLWGYSSTGYGLRVQGKVKFDNRSGTFSVGAGKTSFAKAVAGVTASSIVIAVIQNNVSGTWIRAAVPATGKFTVYFSKALPATAKVGWIILN